ncbi:Acg family FMN-binding oxidoreductase [Mycobacterium sp. ZZG]
MRDTAVDIEVITDAVALASRAPSLHNSQPWRWVTDGVAVMLFLDDAAAPRHTDPTGRELVISCGAALDHFRVAMAAAGWRANTDRFPNPNNRDHLASVDFSPMDFVTDAHRRRADAILRRHTDRLPFAEPPDWDGFLRELAQAPGTAGVSLHVLPDEARAALVKASELTRAARRYDSDYHAELVGWTADVEVAEGIPSSALLSPAERDDTDIGRDFPPAGHGDRRAEITEDRAKVVVLSTGDDDRDSLLRCGEMLSSFLLDATMVGLATCTLSHLTEIAESRKTVAGLTGAQSSPQLLIRVGSAPADRGLEPPTPRRAVSDVLQVRD